MADIDLAVFALAGNEWLDSWLWVQRQTFQTESGVTSCSRTSTGTRHTPNLNFPIKSTPYTHIHTLTTLDTAGCKCGGSGQTQITPPKFRVIPAEPPTPNSTVATCSLSAASPDDGIWDRRAHNGCHTSLKGCVLFQPDNMPQSLFLNSLFSGPSFLRLEKNKRKWSWRWRLTEEISAKHKTSVWVCVELIWFVYFQSSGAEWAGLGNKNKIWWEFCNRSTG